MKRKLFVLAVLVGICVFGVERSASARSVSLCSNTYCAANPGVECICPPGTLFSGRGTLCEIDWHSNCNDV